MSIEDYQHGQGQDGSQSSLSAERVVYYILRASLEAFQSSTKVVDRAFRLLSPREQDRIKRILQVTPPLVQYGYPRRDALPNDTHCVVCVTVGDERMELAFLDGFAEELALDEYDGSLEPPATIIRSEIDQMDVGVWIWADHPDVLLYYSGMVRTILIGGLDVLMKSGIAPISIRGNDLQPDPEYLPELLFVRRYTLSVRGERVSSLDSQMITSFLVEASIRGSEGFVEVLASG